MNPADVDFTRFCTFFEQEEDCVRALFAAKWPEGFRCPRCDHHDAYVISTRRLPLYECHSCRAQTSLTAGTVMEGSRTPLRLWFRAIYLHARPDSINALQLSRTIGVTYKTAWLICHKIRHAMSRLESQVLLSGLVRITDARLCTRDTVPGWHQQEQSLLLGSSENEQGHIVRIKIKKQNKFPLRHRYDCPAVEPFIAENVDAGAADQTIVTRFLGPSRNHTLVRIAREAERELARVFRGIGPKHLQAYLDQFCYIWNHGKRADFGELLTGCATTPTITYPALVGNLELKRPYLTARLATRGKNFISKVS